MRNKKTTKQKIAVKKTATKAASVVLSLALAASTLSGCGSTSPDVPSAEPSSISTEASTSVSSEIVSSEVPSESTPIQEVVPKEKAKYSNFYQEGNADWFAENPLDEKISFTSFIDGASFDIYDSLQEVLDNIDLTAIGEDSSEGKLVRFYRQLCDEEARNTTNLESIKAHMDAFRAPKSVKEFNTAMATPWMFYTNPILHSDYLMSSAGYSFVNLRPETLIGMRTDFTDSEKECIRKNLPTALTILGYSDKEAASMVENALTMNTKIIEYYSLPGGDVYARGAEDIEELGFNSIDLISIMDEFGYSFPKTLYLNGETCFFSEAKYFDLLTELFSSKSLKMMQDYCAVNYLIKTAECGSAELFAYVGKAFDEIYGISDQAIDDALEESPNIAESSLNTVIKYDLGVLAHYYSENYISAQQKADVADFIKDMEDAFCDIISDASWLAPRARERLRVKVKKMTVMYGENAYYNTLEDFEIQDNAIDSLMNLIVSNAAYKMDTFQGQKNITNPIPDTFSCNAFYQSDTNTITLTAALLDSIDVSKEESFEYWLGYIGHVVAHEVGHAFDSASVNLDSDGIEDAFFTDDETTTYFDTYKSIFDTIDGRTAADGHELNYYQFANEYYADLFSMKCCLRILGKMENPDYETYFRGINQYYAAVYNEKYINYLYREDNHLRGEERINLTCGQFDEFYNTFDIDENGSSYIAPENRINVFSTDK